MATKETVLKRRFEHHQTTLNGILETHTRTDKVEEQRTLDYLRLVHPASAGLYPPISRPTQTPHLTKLMTRTARTMTHSLNILISGAGIAGLTAAHFLLRAGHKVTILERAPQLRASGQNVDVRGRGLEVLQQMKTSTFDIEAVVRAKTTEEKGLRFVDERDRVWAEFPAGDSGSASFTGEVEIMRGDLVNIMYDSVKDESGSEMVFGKQIEAINESDGKIDVEVSNGWPYATGIITNTTTSSHQKTKSRSFDLIIAADGITSSTRTLAFGPSDSNSAVKPLGQWSCWFSIPWQPTDSNWARWYNAPQGRMILVRPDNNDSDSTSPSNRTSDKDQHSTRSPKLTRVSLWTMTRNLTIDSTLTSLQSEPIETQKQYWNHLFSTAGWEAPRVLEGMMTAPDFHMQRIAQVKIHPWWKGRIVLVGDAAACPSPISGLGVSVAMVSAYNLAKEINRSASERGDNDGGDDNENGKDKEMQSEYTLKMAFKRYEIATRPFVESAQKLMPGTPGLANPETAFGIKVLYGFLGVVAWVQGLWR